MLNQNWNRIARRLRGPAIFIMVLLIIEFLDEVVFGAREAAWPLIRTDLGLSYDQIGLIFSIPGVIATIIEPFLGILGDMGRRRLLIIGGGVFFAGSLIMMALSTNYEMLMIATIIFYPASGSFVSLSQSTLMDLDVTRHEHNMARWTFAGSLGVVVGSIALGIFSAFGLGWRALFLAIPIAALVLVFAMLRLPFPKTGHVHYDEDGEVIEEETPVSFKDGVQKAVKALRRVDVWRWLILLQFSDLMTDILYGFLALYFVDVVGVTESEAVIAVSVWTVVGLLGDFLLIPLLERVKGLDYLRVSAVVEFVLYTAFLLVPNGIIKLIILGALGFFNSGWYSVLQAQLYSAMPGQSGTVMSIGVIPSLLGSFLPLGIGLLAERFGLGLAMWTLLLGPIALLIGLPRSKRA